MQYAVVGIILAAIVAANLIAAHYGPEASIYNAFFFIGLILTTRDYLWELWGKNRVRNMGLLIITGSIVSYLASKFITSDGTPDDVVAKIALASCVAFAVSETFDAITYWLMRREPWLERANASNVVGAFLDSAIFVSIAFGWTWYIIFAQACAKIAGGFIWSLLLRHLGRVPSVEREVETAR